MCQLFGKVRARRCALVRSTLVGEVHTRDHELRQLTGFLKGLRKPSLAPLIPPASHISYIHIPGTLIFLVVNLISSQVNLQRLALGRLHSQGI